MHRPSGTHQRETEAAIVFADVCDSTRLYEELGDRRAREMIGLCLRKMTEACGEHGGILVKTIGDEILVTFPTSDQAATAARQMHELAGNCRPPVSLRIGMHFGSALLEENDIFGDAVNLAARITEHAKGGQILTTATTVERLSSTWQGAIRQIDRTVPRGKRDQIGLFELIWQEEGVTRMVATGEHPATRDEAALELRHGARAVAVTRRRPVISLGRADMNDVVVDHELVSRLHARIEYRKGRFILIDLSTNGTYVRNSRGEESFVRRDQSVLPDDGTIGLGRSPAGFSEAIAFSHTSVPVPTIEPSA